MEIAHQVMILLPDVERQTFSAPLNLIMLYFIVPKCWKRQILWWFHTLKEFRKQ